MPSAALLYQEAVALEEKGLHDGAIRLGEIALQCNRGGETGSNLEKLRLLLLLGECNLVKKEYRLAEFYYRKALDARQVVLQSHLPAGKTRKVCSAENPLAKLLQEPEIKYRIAQCLSHTEDDLEDAICFLESTPPRLRNAKISLLLGQLQLRRGYDRGAAIAFKDVLKEQPLCIEAAEHLISLGLKVNDVVGMMCGATSANPEGCLAEMAWLIPLLKSKAAIKEGDYAGAVTALESTEIPDACDPKVFSRTPQVLSIIGKAHYLKGDHREAMASLSKAYRFDAMLCENMELLAALYADDNIYRREGEMEKLVEKMQRVSSKRPDVLLCMAYQAKMQKRYQLAMALTHKVAYVDPGSEEAQILLGSLLADQKQMKEAVASLRQAVTMAPYRFEAHARLVDAYVARGKLKEALDSANFCCKKVGDTPRALTLSACVMSKDPSIPMYKVRGLLEKAVTLDPTYLPAVYSLADLYESRAMYDKATDLLERSAALVPDVKLHQKLGEIYLHRKHNQEKAIEHYAIALKFVYLPILTPDTMNDRMHSGAEKLSSAVPESGSEASREAEYSDEEEDEWEMPRDAACLWSEMGFQGAGINR